MEMLMTYIILISEIEIENNGGRVYEHMTMQPCHVLVYRLQHL